MIRVAQVMGKMNGAGVETVIMNYYRRIDRDCVQFDLIVDSDSTLVPAKEVESLGGRLIEVPPYQKQPSNSCELERIFRSERWPIVHSHMNALSVFSMRAAKRAGVPLRIAHSHSTWGRGEFGRNVIKAVLRTQANRYPTHRMACTHHAGEWLFGADRHFYVLKNAIELDKFSYSPEKREALRHNLGIASTSFVVGNVGRLVPQKNQAFLIRAFASAFPEDGSALLLLVGDGPDYEDLQCLIGSLGLHGRALMLGQRDDVDALYSAMDCFCLPSTYEGLGIVAVEAQASGLPTLISTEVPPDAELTLSARYLPLKSEAWSRAMRLVRDAGETQRSFEHSALSAYDIGAEATKLEEYYKSILASVGKGALQVPRNGRLQV